MATVNINFRLDEELKPKLEARAGEVKYRTVSDYLRELVESDLAKVDPNPLKKRAAK